MKEDRRAFYTLNQTFTAIPIRQKVNTPTSPLKFYKNMHNPESAQLDQLQVEANNDEKTETWRPKLPSKKLLDDPKFFVSVERRKYRLLSAMKNLSKFGIKVPEDKLMQGKKVKSRSIHHRRPTSNFEIPAIEEKSAWESSSKIPYLNMNLHYLINKRKNMLTPQPQPQSKDFHLTRVSSTRFNEQCKFK